jgi:hypothetical protein
MGCAYPRGRRPTRDCAPNRMLDFAIQAVTRLPKFDGASDVSGFGLYSERQQELRCLWPPGAYDRLVVLAQRVRQHPMLSAWWTVGVTPRVAQTKDRGHRVGQLLARIVFRGVGEGGRAGNRPLLQEDVDPGTPALGCRVLRPGPAALAGRGHCEAIAESPLEVRVSGGCE